MSTNSAAGAAAAAAAATMARAPAASGTRAASGYTTPSGSVPSPIALTTRPPMVVVASALSPCATSGAPSRAFFGGGSGSDSGRVDILL